MIVSAAMSGSTRLLSCLLLAALLSSCSRESDSPPKPEAAPAGQAAVAAAPDPVAGYVAAVAVGTTGLPLSLRFEVPAPPLVGQPAKVTFGIAVEQAVDRIEIQGRSAALMLDEATAKLVFEGMEPGKVRQFDLGFTSQAEGLSDIELDIRLHTGADILQSSYAIPVLTIAAAAPADGG